MLCAQDDKMQRVFSEKLIISTDKKEAIFGLLRVSKNLYIK